MIPREIVLEIARIADINASLGIHICCKSYHTDEFKEIVIEKINWTNIKYERMSEDLLRKYCDQLPERFWYYGGYDVVLSDDFITEFSSRWNWNYMSKYQKLSENIMRKYADKLNWFHLSSRQKMSEEFIEEQRNNVFWVNILFHNPHVSLEFKEKHKKYERWGALTNRPLYGPCDDNIPLDQRPY